MIKGPVLQLRVDSQDGKNLSGWTDVPITGVHDETLENICDILQKAKVISSTGAWVCTGISFQMVGNVGPITYYRLKED